MNQFIKVYMLAHMFLKIAELRGEIPSPYQLMVVFGQPLEVIEQAISLIGYVYGEPDYLASLS